MGNPGHQNVLSSAYPHHEKALGKVCQRDLKLRGLINLVQYQFPAHIEHLNVLAAGRGGLIFDAQIAVEVAQRKCSGKGSACLIAGFRPLEARAMRFIVNGYSPGYANSIRVLKATVVISRNEDPRLPVALHQTFQTDSSSGCSYLQSWIIRSDKVTAYTRRSKREAFFVRRANERQRFWKRGRLGRAIGWRKAIRDGDSGINFGNGNRMPDIRTGQYRAHDVAARLRRMRSIETVARFM